MRHLGRLLLARVHAACACLLVDWVAELRGLVVTLTGGRRATVVVVVAELVVTVVLAIGFGVVRRVDVGLGVAATTGEALEEHCSRKEGGEEEAREGWSEREMALMKLSGWRSLFA